MNRQGAWNFTADDTLGCPMHPHPPTRILVVEDETMIAMLIEDMLCNLGCVTVGPAYNVAKALELIQSERFDAAILDVNLAGERTTPVAQALHIKSIPFFFATGYGPAGVAAQFSKHLVLTKPFQQSELERALKSLALLSYPAAGSAGAAGAFLGRSEEASPIGRPWM
jgi:CheY-like chemotaxis protein